MPRPIKQLITAYLAAGGATMDESHYQRYKHAILLDWIISEQQFEVIDWQDAVGQWHQKKTEKPSAYVCKSSMDCEFITHDIESAIDHLVKHWPEYFVDQNQTKQAKKGATNGSNIKS